MDANIKNNAAAYGVSVNEFANRFWCKIQQT